MIRLVLIMVRALRNAVRQAWTVLMARAMREIAGGLDASVSIGTQHFEIFRGKERASPVRQGAFGSGGQDVIPNSIAMRIRKAQSAARE